MADLDWQVEKAFDFAQEVTKKLITLATGVIALTITFLTSAGPNAARRSARHKRLLAITSHGDVTARSTTFAPSTLGN